LVMEGMVANRIGNFKRTYLGQFGDILFKWKSLLEWTCCIPVIVWRLYIWLAYWQTYWGTYYYFPKVFTYACINCSYEFLEWTCCHYH
jgi:hypothetical protein